MCILDKKKKINIIFNNKNLYKTSLKTKTNYKNKSFRYNLIIIFFSAQTIIIIS